MGWCNQYPTIIVAYKWITTTIGLMMINTIDTFSKKNRFEDVFGHS